MVTYVLDASAILRFLDKEAGGDQIASIFKALAIQESRTVISAVQWGEIASVLCRRNLVLSVAGTLQRLEGIGIEVIPASAQQAVQAGILQCSSKLPYADAFMVVLAQQLGAATIVTADYDLVVANHLVPIEFLPRKPKQPPDSDS